MGQDRRWWENNLHRGWVAAGLPALVLVYYLFLHGQPVLARWPTEHLVHRWPGWIDWGGAGAVLANAVLGEYIPFIVLLFSLYTISGGIRIEGDLPAHPLTNTAVPGVGGVLASLIGTTGAAMLLIRPLLETNRERKHVRHTVVFFIFIVCNCGGCLLPIGDPPLFLGYLLGVPFLWTLRLWPQWLLVNGVAAGGLLTSGTALVLSARGSPARHVARDETSAGPARCGSAACGPTRCCWRRDRARWRCSIPAKPLPGTAWHPWLYLREAVQLALVAAVAGCWGRPAVRRANRFNYAAIVEVAVLFLGHLHLHAGAAGDPRRRAGRRLGLRTPAQFFWATRRAVVGPRQRPDLRGLLRDRPLAGSGRHAGGRRATSRCWRPSAWARCSWAR